MTRKPAQGDSPQHIGELFALGSAHVDILCEKLRSKLVGSVVQRWQQVYEISREGWGCKPAPPARSASQAKEVTDLSRAAVPTHVRNEKENAIVNRRYTDNTIVYHAGGQEIVIWVTVAFAPAVVVNLGEHSK